MKRTITTLLFVLMTAVVAQAGVIAPGLEAQMEGMQDNEIVKVLVIMKDQTDMQRMDKSLHEARVTRAARNQAVVTTLRDAATATQEDLLGEMDKRIANKSGGGVLGYTPHWIINAVVVVADVATVRQIAARDDVDVVEPDLEVELIEPVMVKQAVLPNNKSEDDSFVAPGVIAVNAPRVWYELGLTGEGTLVANMDSGVDVTHPMLVDRWNGNFVPADQAWRDHGGAGSPDLPFDSFGHGTHVMGTITGATATDTLGVAPGARWMASNAIWADNNTFDNMVIAGFEFFADPDGDPLTSDDVPDVVQNSWGVTPSSIRGYVTCDSRWWETIDNCEAAGVVVTWSAGNEGPNPGTIRIPVDRASSPTNTFSIGSANENAPYYVSSFSSRGPSGCGGVYQIKPEVTAPGENIISAYPNDQYSYMSGTSMAGPHVAGIVALMREASPDLDVITIKEILMETAIDTGPTGNDNANGWGFVDAYAAVMAAFNDVGRVKGAITAADTGQPLGGVRITRPANGARYTTDGTGQFEFSARAGEILLEIDHYGYHTSTLVGILAENDTLTLDAALIALPQGTVSGTVYGPDGQSLAGAVVRVLDAPIPEVVTGHDGRYSISMPLLEDANFTLAATALDLAYLVEFIGLAGDRELDFHLPYIIAEGFETGTMTSFPWMHGGDVLMAVDPTVSQEGIFSVRSGDVQDNETSELSIDYYVTAEGDMSFWVKTSSEEGYDGLVFFVDGIYRRDWSGNQDWVFHTESVAAGQHNFRWVYTKDYAVSVGQDGAWIDRIEFPGTGVQPTPRVTIDVSSLSMALNPGLSETEVITLGNTGGYRLDFTVEVEAFPVTGLATSEELLNGKTSGLLDGGLLLPREKSAAADWVSVSPDTSWVHPGVTRPVEVTFDATGLDHGVYYARLDFLTNDPLASMTSVPLVFNVGGVSAVDNTPLPAGLTFQGAVPNPFNPMTYISYSLPSDHDVSLKVYDVSGRLVRDLVQGNRSAGNHRERWDGRDDSGQEVASGVYFARLSAGAETRMKQMLLLR